MDERDRSGPDGFVERFALHLAPAGMPRMAAGAFAGLLIAPDARRTAAEIAERLRVSPAAVSGAVRQAGLVVREREPGRRRDHYRIQDDRWHGTIVQRDGMLEGRSRTLAAGVDAVGADAEAGRRLAETRRSSASLRAEMPALVRRWRAQR